MYKIFMGKTKGENPVSPDADMKVWKVEYHSKLKFQSSPAHSQDRYDFTSIILQRGRGFHPWLPL